MTMDEKIILFNQWAKDNGILLNNLDLRRHEDMFGLFTTADIPKNEVTITVPFNCMLTPWHLQQTPEWKEWQKDLMIKNNEVLQMSLFLLLEKKKGKKSFYFSFFQLLPETFTLPVCLTNETDLKALSHTFINNEVEQMQQMMNKLYDYCQQKVKSFSFTKEEFLWANYVLMTRQNKIPINGKQALVLIPGWDFCNHSSDLKEITTNFDVEQNCLITTAPKTFSTYTEFSIYYGNRSQKDFYLHQGFMDYFHFDQKLFEIEKDLLNVKLKCGLNKMVIERLKKSSPEIQGLFKLYPGQKEVLVTYYPLYSINSFEYNYPLYIFALLQFGTATEIEYLNVNTLDIFSKLSIFSDETKAKIKKWIIMKIEYQLEKLNGITTDRLDIGLKKYLDYEKLILDKALDIHKIK